MVPLKKKKKTCNSLNYKHKLNLLCYNKRDFAMFQIILMVTLITMNTNTIHYHISFFSTQMHASWAHRTFVNSFGHVMLLICKASFAIASFEYFS